MGPWLATLSLPALFGVVAGFFVGVSALSSALGLLGERLFAARRIWSVPLDPGQVRFELIGNLAYLGVEIAAFVAAIHFGWLRFGEAAWAPTFVALYVGFQVLYYGLHRALHQRALVRFHRWHHRSRVTTPFSGQSMSVVEALGWAGCYLIPAVLYGAFFPLSAEGMCAYLVFNVFGNVFGHANFDPASAASRTRLVSLVSPPFLYHALHHARWTGHYGFASAGLDSLLGTEFPDWRSLHARIAAGRPLDSLKARGDG